MAGQDQSRKEALRRLQERADALESRTAAPTVNYGHRAVGQAYRILVELLAGVAVGLVAGLALDQFAGTRPWGIIGGVLLGFAVSLWMAKRTADRLMAEAAKEGPPPAVPFDEEEE